LVTTTATTYLPTPLVGKVHTFVHFNSTVTALNTDIQGSWGSAGTIVVQADTVTGQTSNAVIIFNDNIVFSVAPGNWVGYNFGQWAQYTPAQVNGNSVSLFSTYFSS
jgi:hypothetical protein